MFQSSRTTVITRYSEAGLRPKGKVMTVTFELNGEPHFTFTDGVSLAVECQTQAESTLLRC
jgi:predicted 3-demethylubiquinone-9 3-methyltransferase (glyoxalase superfamily)